MATVTSFKNYVKKQKAIREEITRFSVKPYHRVYKEMVALKQLLSVVSNGLQRNAVAIHKLKLDSAQELKNTEIAHRTNEIPPALQLENYAPTEYFQRLMEQFEEQMHLCRQQIEQMESLMASLTQPNMYTPQELTTVMVRLNETFIALAAQLQLVHESVRVQKEQYLNYHRVYHGITENIFLVHKKASEHGRRVGTLPTGPGAFDNVSNAASIAVAAALQSAQRPTGIQGAGLTGQFTTGGLGTASTLGSGGFGVGGFGSTGFGGATSTVGLGTGGIGSTGGLGIGGSFGTQLGGVQGSLAPMGSTTGFGMGLNTVAPTPFGFGVSKPTGTAASFGGSLSAGPTAGSTGFGFGTGGSSSFASTTTTGKPLQLQKPPSKFRKGVR